MLTSKEVLEQTGISRATLNNYIADGLLPRPDVLPPEPEHGAAPRIGYFPDGTIERVREIQRLKAEGWTMARIAQHFESGGMAAPPARPPMGPPSPVAPVLATGQPRPAAIGQPVLPGLEDVNHAAYAVNTDFQVLWSNTRARSGELGSLLALPEPTDRPTGILACLLRGRARGRDDLVGLHLQAARQRDVAAASLCQGLGPEDSQRVLTAYAVTPRLDPDAMPRARLDEVGGRALGVHAVQMRRGVLFLYAAEAAAPQPAAAPAPVPARKPAVLARVAVLAARLEDAAGLWLQLPAQEYFELASEVGELARGVAARSGGQQARQPGEGAGMFFIARAGDTHLRAAVDAAQRLREGMRQVARRWQLRKGWARELWLDIGLADGEDWIASPADGSLPALMGDATLQALTLAEAARDGTVWATRALLGKLPAAAREPLRFGARFNGEFIDGCFMRAADIGPGTTPAAEAAFAAAEILAAPPAADASPDAARPPLSS